MSAASKQVHERNNSAWIIIVASGVVAGLHIRKLAPALPVIPKQLGLSLLFTGTLLGVVQVAGMLGDLAVSLLSEVISQRRTLLLGLLLLVLGSTLGGASQDAYVVLATRIIEGAGVIITTVMGPGLVRLHAPLTNLNVAVGWWAAYMDMVRFLGVFTIALVLQHMSWSIRLWILSALTLLPFPLVLRFVGPVPQQVPPGCAKPPAASASPPNPDGSGSAA